MLSKINRTPKKDKRPMKTYRLYDTKTNKVLYTWEGQGLELHLEEFDKKCREDDTLPDPEEYEKGANDRYQWTVER